VSDKNNDSTESSEPGAATPAEVDEPVKSPKASPKKEKSSGKGSSGVAWLALLLVLGIAGAGVWLGKQALGREAQLSARIVALESAPAASEDTSVADLSQLWQTQLAAESAKREELSRTQTEQLQGIESRLAQQRAELSRFGAVDRQDWLLAEAQYLLRLANQRLIMADDVVAAKALLGSADSILKELDDVTLYAVRAAVAADLAAVRAVPQRDVQGMYLALAALIEQADKLVIFQMPEKIERARVEPAEDWQGRLLQGYEAALLKLSDYLIIRRRDVPIEALMDPQWEGLVRQNLRMLLEQAQVALLSGNELLFRESLERAQHWLTEFFVSDEAAAKALADEVAVLREAKIALEMPDISRSLAAVDEALKQRMQNGGGE
jgi:uroporphyrin-3 C-methyltransferase